MEQGWSPNIPQISTKKHQKKEQVEIKERLALTNSGGQTKGEQNLMKGGSSGKVMMVNDITSQKSTLAINKDVIKNTERPQTSTLREERPLKGSSNTRFQCVRLERRLWQHRLFLHENHYLRARERVCTSVCVCVWLCCKHVSTGSPGRKIAGCFLWLVQTSPAEKWDESVRERLMKHCFSTKQHIK